MEEWKMLLAAVVLQTLFITGSRGHAVRRSMGVASLPMSKGGWRPVVGNNGFPGYSLVNASPLQAPKYKIPSSVGGDSYPVSSKPVGTRESTKLSSIAQSYKPTTLRSVPMSNLNAPVNSYLNPFSLPNAGLSHYKIVQNFPVESLVIRNPNSAYRPVYKFSGQNINSFNKNQLHNAMMQQLAAQKYHMYPTTLRSPQDLFSKPVEIYVRPTEGAKKPDAYARPEPSKTPTLKPVESSRSPVADSAGAQQNVKPQQVKTAQQALQAGTLKPPSIMPYQQYTFKDEKFSPVPPSVLGSFGTFGFQSVKARDPAFFGGTRTTYLPPAPTKHTVFNSFSFTPTFSNQDKFITTTPKLKPSQNQIVFGNFANDFKNLQVQQVKQNVFKQETNVPNKYGFKASPQDPFAKPNAHTQFHTNEQLQLNNYYFPSKLNQQFPQTFQNYYTTETITTVDTNDYSTNPVANRFTQVNPPYTTLSTYYGNQKKPDQQNKNIKNVSPTVSVQNEQSQYSVKPSQELPFEATPDSVPFRATYEVTETYDIVTQPPKNGWLNSPNQYNGYNNQPNPTKHSQESEAYDQIPEEDPTNAPQPPSQYGYTTEPDENKGYDNSLTYVTDVETQSRRPLGDDFEPNHIQKHKLKDYYYKVTTPTSNSVESTARYSDTDVTTYRNNKYRDHSRGTENDGQLPTLPPNKYFKRPIHNEPTEKDKVRKRNKNRRRRPTPNPAEKYEQEYTTTPVPIEINTSEEETFTLKPRIRVPVYAKPQQTTPTVTTDLSTSALPTVSPTSPTVIRKKLSGRRTTTAAPNDEEYTTVSNRVNENVNKGSSIMKISNRPGNRPTTLGYEYSTSETPDYSHKQDEKDTPTSDISVNTSGDNKNIDEYKNFDFHVNVKPIDNKLELYPSTEKLESALDVNDQEEVNKNTESKIEDSEPNTITTPKAELSQLPGKVQRPRLKNNKYDNNRPRFSVKDYRNRLSSTTTTERSHESSSPKLRFPQRRLPNLDKLLFDNETTEAPRKKFTPKDPRHKQSEPDSTKIDSTTEKQTYSTRISIRHRPSTEAPEAITPKISSRIRTNPRNQPRKSPSTEEPLEVVNQTPHHIKRPQRKKHKETIEKDSLSEGSEDIAITESSTKSDQNEDATSERYRSESAIMKIAKDEKKHQENPDHTLHEHSKRVSDLTLAASKDYNTPGLFKTVSPNSRRIPNYFTIATDDPILPIEAFFPQLNQKKES